MFRTRRSKDDKGEMITVAIVACAILIVKLYLDVNNLRDNITMLSGSYKELERLREEAVKANEKLVELSKKGTKNEDREEV